MQQLFTGGTFALGDPASVAPPVAWAAQLPGVTLRNFGINGGTLFQFNTNPAQPRGFDALVTAAPSLVAFSFSINDVRGGLDQATLVTRMRTVINALRAALPNTDMVLVMPNSFLLNDVSGHNYVTPAGAAQLYTDRMRLAYRALTDEWPNVEVFDSQALVFGEVSVAASALMGDQIHPSPLGQHTRFTRMLDLIALTNPCR
jgi:lysophospholipase L1-like esterase